MKEDLNELFDKYNEKYFNGKLLKIPVTWNNRFRRTAGQFIWNTVYPERVGIQISSKYCKQYPEELTNILVHEMIHLKVFRRDEGHGEYFKAEMERLNNNFPELNITIYTKQSYWKCKYKCVSCGKIYKTQVKFHKEMVCGDCNCDVELLEENNI